MTLSFPNQSRSFDEAGNRIRFAGYDNVFEIAFFMEIDALKKISSKLIGRESAYLAAFDAARSLIEDIAGKAYTHGRANMIVLKAADFR